MRLKKYINEEIIEIPMGRSSKNNPLKAKSIVGRYAYHQAINKNYGDNGIKAYKIREIKAADSFPNVVSSDKFIWLSQTPYGTTEYNYIIDLKKLDADDLRTTGQGVAHILHRGDIPDKAIVKKPPKDR